jgi:hypothetical protein
MITKTELQDRLMKIPQDINPALDEFVRSKVIYENLKGQQKTILAGCESCYTGTEAEKKRRGLSDVTYKDHLKALNLAHNDFLKAWAKLEKVKTDLACMQSINKLEVATINIDNF